MIPGNCPPYRSQPTSSFCCSAIELFTFGRWPSHDSGEPGFCQYLSLPHLFLLDSGSPVGFLLDCYWISTNFLKRDFHIFFHFPSYWTPTRLLLDSHWTPIGLQLNLHKVNAMDSYWIPNHFV